MNTIQEQLTNAIENPVVNRPTQGTPSKPSGDSAPVRLTKADIHARRLARLHSRADGAKVIDESVVTDFVEISDELRSYERELEPLKKKNSTIPVEQLNSARASLESKIRECREELEDLSEDYPGIVTATARREELRASARNIIRTVGSLDPANSDKDDVQEFLKNAVGNGVLAVSGELYVATVEDPVLQEAEARVADFLDAVKTAREEERRERADDVKDYLLSDRPAVPGGQSPLQTEKSRPGRVSYTELKAGKGERAFVPVFGTKKNASGEPTGEEYFMGEALIAREGDNLMVVKASRVNLCEKLFFSYDRREDKVEERGTFAIPSNLETLHPKFFREALQRQLVRDTESADRREKANLLSTVENYKDAGTFADLRTGEGRRWVVNSKWTPTGGKERTSFVTYHVESDGKNFQITEAACDLKEVDEAFFGMYMKPTPLSALSTDKRWLAQAALNRPFECEWELRRFADKHGNVIFVTEENVADVFGPKGVNGVYSAIARWLQQTREKSDAPKHVPIGYLVERRDEKVAFIEATSGTAAGLIEKEQDAYPVTDLPLMTRAVARAIWMAAKMDFGTVPEYLKSSAKPTSNK